MAVQIASNASSTGPASPSRAHPRQPRPGFRVLFSRVIVVVCGRSAAPLEAALLQWSAWATSPFRHPGRQRGRDHAPRANRAACRTFNPCSPVRALRQARARSDWRAAQQSWPVHSAPVWLYFRRRGLAPAHRLANRRDGRPSCCRDCLQRPGCRLAWIRQEVQQHPPAAQTLAASAGLHRGRVRPWARELVFGLSATTFFVCIVVAGGLRELDWLDILPRM